MIINDLERDIPDVNLDHAMDKIYQYVKDTFINEFVAADIAISYENDALYSEPFDVIIDGALEDLAQVTAKLCDKKSIKTILKEKYFLKIIKDNPVEIEKVKDI